MLYHIYWQLWEVQERLSVNSVIPYSKVICTHSIKASLNPTFFLTVFVFEMLTKLQHKSILCPFYYSKKK